MSAHTCETLQPEGQCYRCDLNRDEMTDLPPIEETT